MCKLLEINHKHVLLKGLWTIHKSEHIYKIQPNI